MWIWFALAGAGAGAGLLSGLFGVGGGVILVPVLLVVLPLFGMPAGAAALASIAGSLAAMVFTSASASWSHHRRGGVRWRLWLFLTAGAAVGTPLGSRLATLLPQTGLLLFFAAYLCLSAARMVQAAARPGSTAAAAGPSEEGALDRRLSPPWVAWHGAGIALVSVLLGIGGGTLTVPYLARRHIPMAAAVGTSSAFGFPIALFGALSYATTPTPAGAPVGTVGAIFLPAVVAIAALSLPFARLGAVWAHRLPRQRLSQAFALFMLLTAGRIVWKVLVHR